MQDTAPLPPYPQTHYTAPMIPSTVAAEVTGALQDFLATGFSPTNPALDSRALSCRLYNNLDPNTLPPGSNSMAMRSIRCNHAVPA